jgi:tRNA 2-thiouridine synthesizing protein A
VPRENDAEAAMAETGEAAIRPDQTLDAVGLLCPLPVLKARRALRDVPAGGILEVLADDPGAAKDFAHFCRAGGCAMIEQSVRPDGVMRFLLKTPA